MNYKKYIIAHPPGTSGIFVCRLLDRLILNSEKPIEIFANNSARDDTAYEPNIRRPDYTGVSTNNTYVPNVYDIMEFAPPGKTYSSILTTSTYPNFSKINAKYDDVGIIVINFTSADAKEIAFNSVYKNKNIQLSNTELETDATALLKRYSRFATSMDYPNNCLVLQYTDLFRDLSDELNTINQIKQFTGITNTPESVESAYTQYLAGRTGIVNQFGLR